LHPDPVTDSKVRILEVSGLLARQSEISESIIMMERQLRQAELLNKLMVLRGPETPIEIAPGRFETFSDTPAGRRLAYEIEESEITARIRILELRLKEEDLTKALSAPVRAAPVIPAAQSPEELQVPVILRKPTYSLLEILGRNGSYSAIVDVGGKGIMVEAGEALPDGSEVRSISPDGMVIFRDGNIVELRINRTEECTQVLEVSVRRRLRNLLDTVRLNKTIQHGLNEHCSEKNWGQLVVNAQLNGFQYLAALELLYAVFVLRNQ